jgi:hypothetical protein
LTDPAPAPATTDSQDRRPLLCAWLVVAASFLLYVRGLNGPFLYDDTFQIVDNPVVRDLGLALRTFGNPSALAINDFVRQSYRPLLPLEYALIHAVFGMHPFGFHLVLALLHALNAAMLFALLRRASGAGPAAWATAWWAFHPVHVEAVQFASGLRDVSSAMWVLLTLLLLAKRRVAPAVLAFLLALLSKETAVMGAGAIFLGAGLAATGSWRQRLRRAATTAAPFLALAAAYIVLRAATIGVKQMNGYWGGSFGASALTMAKVFLTYLRVTALPVVLRIQYYPSIERGLRAPVVAGLLALTAMIVAGFLAARRRPLPAFGIFWFLLFLLPVSNLTPIVQFMNERFFYLPLMGVAACIAWAVPFLAPRRVTERRRPAGIGKEPPSLPRTPIRGWRRFLAVAAGLAVLALLGVLTFQRIGVWLDEEVFLKDIIAKEPLIPGYQRALGEKYELWGRLGDAEQVFEKMRERWPDSVEFALALSGICAREGRFAEAENVLKEILVRRPHSVSAATALADFLFDRGRFSEALPLYEQLTAAALDDAHVRQRTNEARAALGGGAAATAGAM